MSMGNSVGIVSTEDDLSWLIFQTVTEVWKQDISKDFEEQRLYREGSLQSCFYYHLRRRLGDSTLTIFNAFLYTEFHYKGKRVDLAVVFKENGRFIPISIFEFKHLKTTSDVEFVKDIEKVIDYIDPLDNCLYYLGFIQEAEYSEISDDYSWLTETQAMFCTGRVIELTGGLSRSNEDPMWIVRKV